MRRTLVWMMLAVGQLVTAQVLPADSVKVLEGVLNTGARYRMEMPVAWNGRALLYSRGYSSSINGNIRVSPGLEREQLLAQGYALVASNYAKPGWSLEEAVPDQLAVMSAFEAQFGKPQQVVAWGSSMGGLISLALLEQYPQKFDAGIALCASASGTLGMMNTALDGAWVFSTLIKTDVPLPSMLRQTGAADQSERAAWKRAVEDAQSTPLGRARLALAASVSHIHPWSPGRTHPASNDITAMQLGMKENFLAGVLLPRDDQEKRAGGNFSWNQSVRYDHALSQSGRLAFVKQLYQQAGASLEDDLEVLARAPRVVANEAAVNYMKKNYVPSGQMQKPFLLMQTVSDPMTLPEFTEDYKRTAEAAGRGAWVRTTYVDRVGHCNFTPQEVLASLQAVQNKLSQSEWRTSPSDMNQWAGSNTFVVNAPPALNRACSVGPRGCDGKTK